MQFEYKTNSVIRSCMGGALSAGEEVTVTLDPARATALGLPEDFVAEMVSLAKVDCQYCYVFEVTDPVVLASGLTLKQCDFDADTPIECYSCCDAITDNFAQLMCDAFNSDPKLNAGIKDLIEECLGDPTSELAIAIKALIEACIADPTTDLAIAFKDLIATCLTNDSADVGTAVGAAFKAAIEACLNSDGSDQTTIVGAALKDAIEACLNADAADTATVVGAAAKTAIIACLTQAVDDPTSDSGTLLKQIVENCLLNDNSDLSTVVGQSLKAAINSCLVAAAANPTGPAAESIKTLIEACITSDATDATTPVGGAVKDAIVACLQAALADPTSDAGLALKEFIENCLTADSTDVATAVGAALKAAIEACLADAVNNPSSLAAGSLKSIIENCLSADASDTNSAVGGAIKAAILACLATQDLGPSDAEVKELIEDCISTDSGDQNTVVGSSIKSAIEDCLVNDGGDTNTPIGTTIKDVINACIALIPAPTDQGDFVQIGATALRQTNSQGATQDVPLAVYADWQEPANGDEVDLTKIATVGSLAPAIRVQTATSTIALGEGAGESSTGLRQSALGFDAGENNTGANQAVVGFATGQNNTGNSQTAMGFVAGQNNTGVNQVAIGTLAGQNNIGANQTAVGPQAGRDNTGVSQSAFGIRAGSKNTGSNQTAAGGVAGTFNSGIEQSAFGFVAGHANSGAVQTAIGANAGGTNSGDNQTTVGFKAGENNTGNNNTSIGVQSLINTFVDNNTAIGYLSGGNTSTTGSVTTTLTPIGGNQFTISPATTEPVGSTIGVDVSASTVTDFGLQNYPFVVISPTVIELDPSSPLVLGTTGTATAEILSIPNFTNTTYLGHRSQATAANQAVVGNPSQNPVGFAPFGVISDSRDKVESEFDNTGHGLELINNIPIRAFKFNHRARYNDIEVVTGTGKVTREVFTAKYSKTAEPTLDSTGLGAGTYSVSVVAAGQSDEDELIEFLAGETPVGAVKGLESQDLEIVVPEGEELNIRYVVGDNEANKGESYEVSILQTLEEPFTKIKEVAVENDGSRANETENLGWFAQDVQRAAEAAGVAKDYIVQDMKDQGGEDVLMVNDQAMIAELILANQQLLARVEQLENA